MAGPYVPDPTDVSKPFDADWVKVGAAELRALKVAFTRSWIPKLIDTKTYAVVKEDLGQLLIMRNGGTITIPEGLPFGLIGISGLQQTTVQVDQGVAQNQTLIVPQSLMSTLYEDYAFALVMRVSQNEWLISGNLMFNASTKQITPDRTVNPVSELQEQMVQVIDKNTEQDVRIKTIEDKLE